MLNVGPGRYFVILGGARIANLSFPLDNIKLGGTLLVMIFLLVPRTSALSGKAQNEHFQVHSEPLAGPRPLQGAC